MAKRGAKPDPTPEEPTPKKPIGRPPKVPRHRLSMGIDDALLDELIAIQARQRARTRREFSLADVVNTILRRGLRKESEQE